MHGIRVLSASFWQNLLVFCYLLSAIFFDEISDLKKVKNWIFFSDQWNFVKFHFGTYVLVQVWQNLWKDAIMPKIRSPWNPEFCEETVFEDWNFVKGRQNGPNFHLDWPLDNKTVDLIWQYYFTIQWENVTSIICSELNEI